MGKPIRDLTGQVFGRLTVVRIVGSRTCGGIIWGCRCECGKDASVARGDLVGGKTKSCGCYGDETRNKRSSERVIDLTGRRFGDLTVIRRDGTSAAPTWICECAVCGKARSYLGQNLRSGATTSCGGHRKTAVRDLTGKVFGHLKVLSPATSSGRGKSRWLCECTRCGASHVTAGTSMSQGLTVSCGCLKRDLAAARATDRHRVHNLFGQMVTGTDIARICGLGKSVVCRRLANGQTPERIVKDALANPIRRRVHA